MTADSQKLSRCPARLHLLACVLIAFSSGASLASTLPDERDFLGAMPTVTSATRLTESLLNTPAAVTIIDRDLIEASTVLTIPDLLRLVPGFQVAHATGAVTTATRHGVADQLERRFEVMVNGNAVYVPVNASMEWNLLGIPIENVERIEVVRSPNAPAFGGNATFGSINIITRDPLELSGGYLRGTVGSLETRMGVARLGGRLGDMDSVASIQYSEDDGFADVNDHKRITNLRFHGNLGIGLHNTLDIELGYSQGEVGADGETAELEPFRDRRLRGSYQSLTWRNKRPNGEGFRLALSHQATMEDDSYPVYVAPDLFLELGFYNSDAERFDVEFEQWIKPTPSLRLLWGGGARYDIVKSDLYLASNDGEVSAWTGRVLAAAEWKPIDRITVNLNALSEFSEVADTYTSPRLGLNWRIAQGQAVRVSASRNYRVFGVSEQVSDYQLVLSDGTVLGQLFLSTGPGLKPERVDSVELGYLFDLPLRGLSFDLTLFYEQLEDAGAALRDPENTTIWRDRGGHWTTRGVEGQVRFRPDQKTLIFGSYAWAKTKGSEPTRLDINGMPVDWESLNDTTPEHTLALQMSRELTRGLSGTLALFHISDMRWLGEGGPVDAYTRIDAKLTKSLKISDTELKVDLIVQNLTNAAYNEFRDDGVFKKAGNEFERRGFLQLSVDLP